jgi:D-alanyl-D-alanine carboxypeptidase
MKRSVLVLALGLMIGGVAGIPASHAQAPGERRVAIEAAAWVIADATSGAVLDSANANRRLQIGSITKVATAMVVLDWVAATSADLGQFATVPGTISTLSSPNSIGLQPGDQISLRDALYAALMQSDNQAAETLAVNVGRELGGGSGDREASAYFTAQLNALARKLGMRETRFLNAHGLDDLESKAPYSTAADVAKLTNYALGHSGFTFYTSQKERRITWRSVNTEPVSFLLRNTNELLGQANIDGVKTGNTRKAGPCVVLSAAQRPESRQVGEQHMITPRRLTVVVLGSSNRFEVGRALLARGWTLFDQWTAAGRPTKGWKTGATP